MSEFVDNNDINITEQEKKFEEITKYFNEIIKNKELIIDMIKTNKLVYQEKNEENKKKLEELKEEADKVNNEYKSLENKLKAEYVKYHDQYQKHDINFKLLERTCLYYKTLIKEREDEVRKFEEQTIYANQDYHNKKLKLDCLNVQIVEAEFQLKNLQTRIDDKMNKLVEEKKMQEKLEKERLEAEQLELGDDNGKNDKYEKSEIVTNYGSLYSASKKNNNEISAPYQEMEFDRSDLKSIATEQSVKSEFNYRNSTIKKSSCIIY